jgi:cysteinyl-tRNA synthetase
MRWPSPWGLGYPGWHVECSAMSTKYLGEHFDIHGGGMDNQFPHHECEIAQSEGAFNKPFANYWMHNNMVTLEGQKMGKSLGNAISLDEFFRGDHKLLSRAWDPQVIRYFLLQSHYRSTTDFSEEALSSAENGLENLQNMIREIMSAEDGSTGKYDLKGLKNKLESKLNDDFNTAQAIAVLFEELRALRKQINDDKIPENISEVQDYLQSFVEGVLGIWPEETEPVDSELTENLIRMLIDMRNKARNEKNFELADTIRDRLNEMGVELMDSREGTDYKIHTSI